MATKGFVPLKAAATKIGRSVARTRQFVGMGKFGLEGTGWIRNQMGNIEIAEGPLATFTAPERGNARAAGIKGTTSLRHVRVAIKLVTDNFKESDKRRIALEVLNVLVTSLVNKAKTAEVAVKADPANTPSAAVEETDDEDEGAEGDDELDNLLNAK